MLEVDERAELRRMRFTDGLAIKEIVRRTGRSRRTVRRAIRSDTPPRYERPPVASNLDPFKARIHELLPADPRLPATRVRELIAEEGHEGGAPLPADDSHASATATGRSRRSH